MCSDAGAWSRADRKLRRERTDRPDRIPSSAACRRRAPALQRRARQLAWGGIAWHIIEFAIALAAGLAARSIALVAFGADSLIEALAGLVVLWLFTGSRVESESAERRAQQLIAGSFFVLAAYVTVESLRTLVGGSHPGVSGWAWDSPRSPR